MPTCPKCGESVSHFDGDIEIWAMGDKKITVRHVDTKCDGKWSYKRN